MILHKQNKTKIIATLGPASSSKDILRAMMLAGTNVFRLNFSHGSYEEHQLIIDFIRELNEDLKLNTSLLVDLQGPKLRIGVTESNDVYLNNGDEVIITTNETTCSNKKIYITYPGFPKDVSIGNPVLIDDGKIKLEVLSTNKMDEVLTRVIHGGKLSSKKGVNLPGTKISLPSLTEKDLRDLDFALKNEVDWIGLSFVRSVTDIIDLKNIIKKHKKQPKVIAKIEKPEAMHEIDNIIDMADAIMVARGDLGVEMPLEEVTLTQKKLVQKCLKASKPIIIATQMMESMIHNFAPTRAEVSDVTNSVMDGADALMLSGETSVGQFPVEVIQQMHKIISSVEKQAYTYYRESPPSAELNRKLINDAIFYNACHMADKSNAQAIITMTHSGYSGFRVSSYRPKASIYVFTDNKSLLGILNLVWGVTAFFYNAYESTDQCIADTIQILQEKGLIEKENIVINIASVPIYERGKANMVKLSFV
jgi:pyruvate kinase